MRSWTFCMRAKLLQSCLTLCDPTDHSPPGSSVHEILQARILEWVAMPSSRGSSGPKDWTWVSCLLHWQAGSLPPVPLGKPIDFLGGAKCNDKYPFKRQKIRRGRDCRDAATSQEHLELPEAGGGKEGFFSRAFRGSLALQ